ncbi:uncharacterized protein LOC111715453 [Eurytemora carolleeae]|uniref:uncharacterized protein LOC111715453 n=1 Tax=Eurytemora carolleeae TaxID=1294199 RepID=UPI000C77164A|nr:uncharacterized protein LOC111715453 [Eurytemora carolleeae]|eukprot:XP_023346544.1 uncharacterized protein LOC111715453 [Eurytemora affinis]
MEDLNVIVRYDGNRQTSFTSRDETFGPGSSADENDLIDEELRIAESMSLAVFLSLQQDQDHQDQLEQDTLQRRGVIGGIAPLETLDEVAEDSCTPSPACIQGIWDRDDQIESGK